MTRTRTAHSLRLRVREVSNSVLGRFHSPYTWYYTHHPRAALCVLSTGEGEGENVSAKRTKKKKKKPKKKKLEQTEPPTIGLTKLFPDSKFPEGELQEYKDE